jgi:hypothetical protein
MIEEPLIQVFCDNANRWTVQARQHGSDPWTVLDDEDLPSLLVFAEEIVTGAPAGGDQ